MNPLVADILAAAARYAAAADAALAASPYRQRLERRRQQDAELAVMPLCAVLDALAGPAGLALMRDALALLETTAWQPRGRRRNPKPAAMTLPMEPPPAPAATVIYGPVQAFTDYQPPPGGRR
jgi:hypothetical protein